MRTGGGQTPAAAARKRITDPRQPLRFRARRGSAIEYRAGSGARRRNGMICLLVLYGTAMGRADMPAMIDAAAETILNPLHSPIPTPAFRHRNSQFNRKRRYADGCDWHRRQASRHRPAQQGSGRPQGQHLAGNPAGDGRNRPAHVASGRTPDRSAQLYGRHLHVADSAGKVQAIPEGMPPEYAPHGVLAAADFGPHNDRPAAHPRAANT